MKTGLLLPSLVCIASMACGAQPSFEKDVVVVDFSDESAATLARAWNRDYLAAITEKLLDAKVRAVVLKMFMDTPGNEAHDARLERAMKRGRVILQASINTDPPLSSNLLQRFEYRGPAHGVKAQIHGNAGWMPIARFQEVAARVCFADVKDATIAPVVEELDAKLYKSLDTCILEEATNTPLTDLGPTFATIGSWRLPITSEAGVRIPLADLSMPAHLTAEDVLLGKAPRERLEDKVAVVTYSGSKSPTFPVGDKAVKVHHAFLVILRDYFAAIQPVPASAAATR